jgi:hypothetical protein
VAYPDQVRGKATHRVKSNPDLPPPDPIALPASRAVMTLLTAMRVDSSASADQPKRPRRAVSSSRSAALATLSAGLVI